MCRPKLIYLARRSPALAREAFAARWRQHGALGMSMPRWKNVWRYTQCDVLSDADGVAGVDHRYDGVALIAQRSLEHRRAHFGDRSSQHVMEVDEAETFAERVANFCAPYDARLVFETGEEAGFKIFRFLQRSANISPYDFNGEWATQWQESVLRLPDFRSITSSYVQNHRAPVEGLSWGLDYDIVEELTFGSLAQAALVQERLIADSRLHEAMAWGVNRAVTVITNEVVLSGPPGKDNGQAV